MNKSKGFIVLNREILDWEWYADINTKVLFLHLLLTANHKEQRWQGKVVGRGELITSVAHLKAQTGLSEQNIRTSLNKLKSTGEITVKSTNRYTLICVVNWGKYQDFDGEDNKQGNEQPNELVTNNQQTTNNKQQCNNVTKEQYIESREKPTKRFIPPTVAEVAAYIAEKHYTVSAQRFVDFYEAKGWLVGKSKMKDWKAAVRSWQSREQTDYRGKLVTESVRTETQAARKVPVLED